MINMKLTSTLVPSRAALEGGAGDSSSPLVTVERFDFRPGIIPIFGVCLISKRSRMDACVVPCREECRNQLLLKRCCVFHLMPFVPVAGSAKVPRNALSGEKLGQSPDSDLNF